MQLGCLCRLISCFGGLPGAAAVGARAWRLRALGCAAFLVAVLVGPQVPGVSVGAEARSERLALPGVGAAERAEPEEARAGDGLELRLAVDDRLTTQAVLPIARVGRCVPLGVFVGLAGAERLADVEHGAVRLRDESGTVDFEPDGKVCVQENGEAHALLGFLCLRLGYTVESDAHYGYVRVLTPRNTATRADFLGRYEGVLRNRRLARAVEARAVRRGLLAVDDEVLEDAFSLQLDGQTYVPLAAAAAALGGEALESGDGLATRVRGDRGEFALLHDPAPERRRGFLLHATGPLIGYGDRLYVEDGALREAFGARIERLPEYEASRFVRGTGARGASAVFASGSADVKRLRAGLKKHNAELFKVAYLTFDDGPSANVTPQVLDILRDQGVQATFFVLGKQAKAYPELVRQIRRLQ